MVYITPGLFGHEQPHIHPVFASSTCAHIHDNHMADPQVAAGLGKRKRRPEDDKDLPSSKHISLSSADVDRFGSTISRTSAANEGHLRLYGQNPASHEPSMQRTYSRSPKIASLERRPVKQMKRVLVKTSSHLMDIEPDPVLRPSPVQRVDSHTKSDLSPCHICSTAPKRKRDLEGYMDCQRCTEKTCYICARQCLRCEKAICKECIVEIGQEGEPWCLECYQHINT